MVLPFAVVAVIGAVGVAWWSVYGGGFVDVPIVVVEVVGV